MALSGQQHPVLVMGRGHVRHTHETHARRYHEARPLNDLPHQFTLITRGYFGAVEKHLAGKAYCARLTTSKCVTDPTFNDDLKLMLKQYKFSVLHFNNGLHGWGYTENQYRIGLAKTVVALQEHAGDARLIWATTTPVREQIDLETFAKRTDLVQVRNQLASEIMTAQHIPTDDLFALVEDHAEWTSGDGVHFNGPGNEALAKQVATSVLENLPSAALSKHDSVHLSKAEHED